MQEFFRPVIQDALRKAEIETGQPVQIEKPASAKFGHFSTNIAFLAAKELGKNPRALAQELIEHLSFPSGSVEKGRGCRPRIHQLLPDCALHYGLPHRGTPA